MITILKGTGTKADWRRSIEITKCGNCYSILGYSGLDKWHSFHGKPAGFLLDCPECGLSLSVGCDLPSIPIAKVHLIQPVEPNQIHVNRKKALKRQGKV